MTRPRLVREPSAPLSRGMPRRPLPRLAFPKRSLHAPRSRWEDDPWRRLAPPSASGAGRRITIRGVMSLTWLALPTDFPTLVPARSFPALAGEDSQVDPREASYEGVDWIPPDEVDDAPAAVRAPSSSSAAARGNGRVLLTFIVCPPILSAGSECSASATSTGTPPTKPT